MCVMHVCACAGRGVQTRRGNQNQHAPSPARRKASVLVAMLPTSFLDSLQLCRRREQAQHSTQDVSTHIQCRCVPSNKPRNAARTSFSAVNSLLMASILRPRWSFDLRRCPAIAMALRLEPMALKPQRPFFFFPFFPVLPLDLSGMVIGRRHAKADG